MFFIHWYYLAVLVRCCAGHSWVEQLSVTDGDALVGSPGYARANVFRSGNIDVDIPMTHLLLSSPSSTISSTDTICSQRQQAQDLSLALYASSGQTINLQFQENGHVTLAQQDRESLGKFGPGNVFVYATQDSRPEDTLLGIHRVWTSDGTGGDGRGFLLGQGGFDDGRCYQINSGVVSQQRQAAFPHMALPPQGADVWCSLNVTVPLSVQSTVLTLYWVWDWPGQEAGQHTDQFYTTCIDVVVH